MTDRRVLIVALSKYFGGADVRVLSLAAALHGQRDYSVAVLADSPLHKRLAADGLNALPIVHRRGSPRVWHTLRQQIRLGGYQVIDAHNPQSQFWAHLAAPKRARRISTVHSAYGPEHDHSLKGRAYESVLHLNHRQGVDFIVVSRAVQAYLVGLGLPPGHLIFNSVSVPPHITQDKNQPLRSSLGWDASHLVLITTARLEPVKGLTYLIAAVAQLRDELPNLRCMIVGEGRERPAIEAQIQALGLQEQVRLLGFRRDVTDLLRASDVFVLPSLSEGLPFALLEAASEGLPLLASKVGGMAELLDQDQTGFLVPAASADALAAGIHHLAMHPLHRRRLGENAYALVKSRFNVDEMIRQTLTVYDA